MSTVYSDPIFIKTELLTSDGKNRITCTLKDQSGRYLADLLRNDSKGFCFGRLVDPPASPSWLVPGTVLHGTINGLKAVLTVEPKIQSRIAGLQNILGDAIHFSYVSVTEFNNSNNDTTNRVSRC
jgi:hypothetical protein